MYKKRETLATGWPDLKREDVIRSLILRLYVLRLHVSFCFYLHPQQPPRGGVEGKQRSPRSIKQQLPRLHFLHGQTRRSDQVVTSDRARLVSLNLQQRREGQM